jgi:hypothetical protein
MVAVPMAHQFSVEIHDYLTSALQTTERELEAAKAKAEVERAGYLEGRLEELRHLRELLTARYDLKLHKYY